MPALISTTNSMWTHWLTRHGIRWLKITSLTKVTSLGSVSVCERHCNSRQPNSLLKTPFIASSPIMLFSFLSQNTTLLAFDDLDRRHYGCNLEKMKNSRSPKRGRKEAPRFSGRHHLSTSIAKQRPMEISPLSLSIAKWSFFPWQNPFFWLIAI